LLFAFAHYGLARLLVQIGDHDGSAFTRKAHRCGAAYSARRACDHCYLVFESSHGRILISLSFSDAAARKIFL
jgi:hypothetical protein